MTSSEAIFGNKKGNPVRNGVIRFGISNARNSYNTKYFDLIFFVQRDIDGPYSQLKGFEKIPNINRDTSQKLPGMEPMSSNQLEPIQIH